MISRLRPCDPSQPGLSRRRYGHGFSYYRPDGRPIEDAEELLRIKSLSIPPAWQDVWICPYENGHLQAVGTDAAGRRQYLYHERWRQRRDVQKFERLERFARVLPELREQVGEHLELPGLQRERVLACAVRLLDLAAFRVGGEEYAQENGTFGLATLRRRHVTVEGERAIFRYPAKGGVERVQVVEDAQVAHVLSELAGRRGGGQELLAYRVNGGWRDVRSRDVNEYLRQVAGLDCSAKDFRTWQATVLAAVTLAAASGSGTKGERRRALKAAVERVSTALGNTPAVARRAYIDPRVIQRYEEGETVRAEIRDLAALPEPDRRAGLERAVLELLAGRRRSRRRRRVAAKRNQDVIREPNLQAGLA